jgi:hypothetical protein
MQFETRRMLSQFALRIAIRSLPGIFDFDRNDIHRLIDFMGRFTTRTGGVVNRSLRPRS